MLPKADESTCIDLIRALRIRAETQWNPAHWLLSQVNERSAEAAHFRAIFRPTQVDFKYSRTHDDLPGHVEVRLRGYQPYTLWNLSEWERLMEILRPRLAECRAYQESLQQKIIEPSKEWE